MRTWGGVGLSVLVCTWGAAFEMDWWWFGVTVSVDTTILHTFLSASACTRLKHSIGADECLTRQKMKHSIR